MLRFVNSLIFHLHSIFDFFVKLTITGKHKSGWVPTDLESHLKSGISLDVRENIGYFIADVKIKDITVLLFVFVFCVFLFHTA